MSPVIGLLGVAGGTEANGADLHRLLGQHGQKAFLADSCNLC